MPELLPINAQTISSLKARLDVPGYDRTRIKTGIAHIGIGGFHRAHQAAYMDALFEKGAALDWGICAIALLPQDEAVYRNLVAQDGFYTLMHKDLDGQVTARIIGSIIEVLWAPDAPLLTIEKLAHPDIRIITLTITEGGYNVSPEGDFNWDNEAVLWDLQHPNTPKTVFGFLYSALKLRYARGVKGLSLQSCDNMEHNGRVLERMLKAFIQKVDPGMLEWLDTQCSFPNSMVDRITPVRSAEHQAQLQQAFGVKDAWPIFSETFKQWIVEEQFVQGRPDWEKVCVQMVENVAPYEKMKIRLLNGGHSLVGLLGRLRGYTFIHEAMQDPIIKALLGCYMEKEVSPLLDTLPGVDLEQYRNQIIMRFSNPFIQDHVDRIISGSSDKIPKYILPSIQEWRNMNKPAGIGALIVAAWFKYLTIALSEGNVPQDVQAAALMENVARAVEAQNPRIFLRLSTVFGLLSQDKGFEQSFLFYLDGLNQANFNAWCQQELIA